MLGLGSCTQVFSSCGEQGLLSCGVWSSRCSGFPCCGAQALVCMGFSNCGERASVIAAHGLRCLVACGIFPDTGIEPVSPALAGQFLTTGPSGKSRSFSSEWGKSLDALPSPFSLRCPVCRGTAETEAVMDQFTLWRRKRSEGTFHSGSGYCTSFPHNGRLTACISEHVF